jgi:hypothetical protein
MAPQLPRDAQEARPQNSAPFLEHTHIMFQPAQDPLAIVLQQTSAPMPDVPTSLFYLPVYYVPIDIHVAPLSLLQINGRVGAVLLRAHTCPAAPRTIIRRVAAVKFEAKRCQFKICADRWN